MSNQTSQIKTMFNAFDLKGSERDILDALDRFEKQTDSFSSDPECHVMILWMKNIFLQQVKFYPRAEELLDAALELCLSQSDPFFGSGNLKSVYL
jgi:hypothetical protein